MKKTTVLILCLALMSLACVTSAAIAETLPTETMEPTIEEPTQAAAVSSATCARVIAVEALHLRSVPSETGRIFTWLKNGDVVQVIDQSDSDWWRIDVRGVVGFARSIYLQIIECS